MSLYFPMFMDLSEKNVLFVGAGHVNTGRIKTMLDFAGSITVVSIGGAFLTFMESRKVSKFSVVMLSILLVLLSVHTFIL